MSAHRWEHVAGQRVTLRDGDLVLVDYDFTTDHDRAMVHPLRTPDGTLMTWTEPADHLWHRGLWFAWNFLDGVDYWGHDVGNIGTVELVGEERVELGERTASVRTAYRCAGTDGAPVLEEQREVVIHAPDGEGRMRLDWAHAFTPSNGAVLIDRTPISEEAPWGGFAGLTWRAAESLGDYRLIGSDGRAGAEVENARARWVDLSGVDADSGRPVGVAIYDHPGNPRHPTHWKCFAQEGFGFVNPALVLAEPYTLAAGETLALRYRVLLHEGWGEAEELEAEAQRFAAATA